MTIYEFLNLNWTPVKTGALDSNLLSAEANIVIALAAILTAGVGIASVRHLYQEMRRSSAIKKFELIHDLNKTFNSFENERLHIFNKDPRDKLENRDIVRIRDYAVAFETTVVLYERQLLTRAELYSYFGARFSEFDKYGTEIDIFTMPQMVDMKDAFDKFRTIVAENTLQPMPTLSCHAALTTSFPVGHSSTHYVRRWARAPVEHLLS